MLVRSHAERPRQTLSRGNRLRRCRALSSEKIFDPYGRWIGTGVVGELHVRQGDDLDMKIDDRAIDDDQPMMNDSTAQFKLVKCTSLTPIPFLDCQITSSIIIHRSSIVVPPPSVSTFSENSPCRQTEIAPPAVNCTFE